MSEGNQKQHKRRLPLEIKSWCLHMLASLCFHCWLDRKTSPVSMLVLAWGMRVSVKIYWGPLKNCEITFLQKTQKLLERCRVQATFTAWQCPSSRRPHWHIYTNSSKGKFVSREVRKKWWREIFRDGRTAVGKSWFFCARLSAVTVLVRNSVITCFWKANIVSFKLNQVNLVL